MLVLFPCEDGVNTTDFSCDVSRVAHNVSMSVPCRTYLDLPFHPGTALDIGAFNTSSQNPVSVDTCGTWLLFNNLFGVTPFVDFCKVTGNICNEEGALARFSA